MYKMFNWFENLNEVAGKQDRKLRSEAELEVPWR